MVSKGGRSSPDLKWDLLHEAHAFSFYQVMRLLPLFCRGEGKRNRFPSLEDQQIRIRPKLSLAFPPADVDKIEESTEEDARFFVTANLLGLYGESSPMPTFYTEDLMDEASSDKTISREFVDIFNHRLYLLLFQVWSKNRQIRQIVEEKDDDHFTRLYALLGIGESPLRDDIRDAPGLLRYIGLFTHFPRSAIGLRTLLQDALGKIPVDVVPCVSRLVTIPVDQRSFLGMSGCTLGQDSFIGRELEDRMGKFRLQLGPLKAHAFQGMLPGTEGAEKLEFLTRFYVVDSLAYDVELILAENEAQPTCLGGAAWSRLGLDTWVFTQGEIGEVSARFSPETNIAE